MKDATRGPVGLGSVKHRDESNLCRAFLQVCTISRSSLLRNRKKASPPDMNFRGGERSIDEHLFDDESHGKAVAFVQCQSIRQSG